LDAVFPDVASVAFGLFGFDQFVFEADIWPPLFAGLKTFDGFSEELVSIIGEQAELDLACDAGAHWPEAPAAGRIAQVLLLVGRANEDALPRLFDFLPAIRWPVTLDGARD